MRDPKAYGKGEAPHLGLVEDPASTTQAGPRVPGLRAPKSPGGFSPPPLADPGRREGWEEGAMRPAPRSWSPFAKGSEPRGLSFLAQSALPPPSLFLAGWLSSAPTPGPCPPSLQRLLSPHHLPFHLLPSPQSVPCPLINSLSPQSAPLPQSMSVDPSLIDCPPSSSPPPPSLTISPPSPEPSITLAPRVGLLWTLTPPPPPLCEGVHPAEHVTPEGLCPSRPFSR